MRDSRTLGLWDPPPAIVADSRRWYQQEACESIVTELATNRSTLCVLATGLGKTEIFSHVARDWKDGRVLVLAHRDELIGQAVKRLERVTSELVEVEQAGLHSGRARIVVGSMQSVCRDHRLERLEKLGGFGLVIVDEAHRALCPSYAKIFDFFHRSKLLGVTATPDRSDARALGQRFDSVAYSMDLCDGIEAGYLVPIKGREIELTEVNLDRVGLSDGDLSAAQLDEEILRGVEGVANAMLAHSGQRQGIVFLPGVQSAHVCAARMNALKEGCAVSVDGETPKEERRALMDSYRSGQTQFLVNVLVAVEGFDAPNTSIIGMARPTKSRSLYSQACGRSTRVLPGIVDAFPGRDESAQRRAAIAASAKPSCLVLDFVGNGTRHTLMTPEDLLGGRYDEETRKLAKKQREETPDADVGEMLENAHNELKRQRLNQAAKGVRSRVRSVSRDFDPFRMLGVDTQREQAQALEYGYKPMSEKQKSFLRRESFADSALEGVSAKAASKLIGNIIMRRENGLMSHRQAAILARFGVDDAGVTSAQASAAIAYVKSAGNVEPSVVRALVSTEEF